MQKIFLCVLCAVLFCAVAVSAQENIPFYTLSVSFDVKQKLVTGTSTIVLREASAMDISVKDLTIHSVKYNGQSMSKMLKDDRVHIEAAGTYEIAFEGRFTGGSATSSPVYPRVISEEGICLTGSWYPSLRRPAFYHLRAIIPDDFVAVAGGDTVTVKKCKDGNEYAFAFSHPGKDLSLVASRYREIKDTADGVEIHGYFLPEDLPFATSSLQHAVKYLKLYQNLISPYPFQHFSIAQNFFPTGFSMPAVAVLDNSVLKDTELLDKSLQQSMVRQWFGNFVFVDSSKGNWADGLTAYLSDHFREEQAGQGWQYRKQILVDYQYVVNPSKETPLKEIITSDNNHATRAIGFGKGAMIFHMLKRTIGHEEFSNALKQLLQDKGYQEASWEDIRIACEKASGQNLRPFFSQWLNRKDTPSIEIIEPRVLFIKGAPAVTFDIVQNGDPYHLDLILKIRTDRELIEKNLRIEKGKESFEIPVQGNPVEMVIDGDYDVMRKISGEENPPVISKLLKDEKKLILVSSEEKDTYSHLVNILTKKGFAVKEESDVNDEDIKEHSLLLLGSDGPVFRRLFGEAHGKGIAHGFSLDIRKNPLNEQKVIGIVSAVSEKEADQATKQLSHYGEYSSVLFKQGRSIEKHIVKTDRGIVVNLEEPVLIVQPQKVANIDDIITGILNKPVIYVGERHTSYEDHKVQLRIIRSLYEKGRAFAIGMEMFQKPFQKYIDDYLSGVISEREFLKKTQYFKRWQFDYQMYREIIEYAKAHSIPVIALNLWTEITKKVSSEGLDSLTDIERQEVPSAMDMSDEHYRERLKEIFRQHKIKNEKAFDNFYQAQILWDETMAHTVAGFLRQHPEHQMVVLAGSGHIMYDSGIPRRVYRLNGKDYVTLLPDTGSIETDLGDYLYSAESIPPPAVLKLGVILKEKNDLVEIEKIVPGSIAKSVGLEKGDILVALDDWNIEDIADVNIFMLDKKRGDKITVKVLRKRFLLGYKELVLTGTI
jgi:uncharacterized iron-regulated protein